MKWIKKGLIYSPNGESSWADNSFLTPQPFILDDATIRVYGSFRDREGRGRIGYVDVDALNPARVLRVSKTPVLDLGAPGMFDDNGVILGDVLRYNGLIYMYYVGFQLVKSVKFLAYSGLAISHDGGESFIRHSPCPIMDRTDNALYIRAIHSVIREQDRFRVWYSVGNGWQDIDGVLYPKYNIRYTESIDGIHFLDPTGHLCVDVCFNEYRIGRPKVRKISSAKYEMRYTSDTLRKEYKAGYAESDDGVKWSRMDELSGLTTSPSGWDSEMACYPAIINANEKTYMFYDGNGMGKTGFGYAEQVPE